MKQFHEVQTRRQALRCRGRERKTRTRKASTARSQGARSSKSVVTWISFPSSFGETFSSTVSPVAGFKFSSMVACTMEQLHSVNKQI